MMVGVHKNALWILRQRVVVPVTTFTLEVVTGIRINFDTRIVI